MVLIIPSTMLILNFTQLGIVWFGAKAVQADKMMVGDIMAFIGYSMQVIFSFLIMSMVSVILPRAVVSWRRVYQILKTKPTIIDTETPFVESKENKISTLEFQNVSFSYPGAKEKVLNNINFTAKKGEITAFIGSTGCGKSTLINLIPRFYDVTEGSIVINENDIKNYLLTDLHDIV